MTLIRVIDLETTGTEPADEVVEIGAVDVALNTHTKAFEELRIFGTDLVRPNKSIPPEASAVHHLTNLDVMGGKLWHDIWPLYCAMEVGIYAAHNAAFEAQFISDAMRHGAPFICTYKCALRVWPDAPKHSNQVLRYWLAQQPGIGFDVIDGDPHRALHDAQITAAILVRLLNRASLQDLIEWSTEPALLPTCPIGEWRGKKWPEIDEGFLKWMIKKPVDDPDLIWNARRELKRRWDEEDCRRKAYVDWFKKVITTEAPYSVADLEQRFREERDESFPLYGITPNTGEYKIIVAACAERKAQLLKEQEHASAA